MDCGSVSSELIESLEYLRPSVKRISRNHDSVRNVDSTDGIRVLKHFRTKFAKKTQHPQIKGRAVQSSSSLILETTEKEISEKYTVLNFSDLFTKENERNLLTKPITCGEEKPTIKVTITPKTVQTQTLNIIKKRKHVTKKVQATVSNHETNSQTNNLLLVADETKDKVYEFKRTGSTKLFSNNSEKSHKDDNVSLDQISSLKLVLGSLNMDGHKEVKRRSSSRKPPDSPPVLLKGNDTRGYSSSNTNRADNAPDAKMSCVRVTGRLGLTEDDRYVLRCDATVDDEPIDSAVYFYSNQKEERRVPFSCNVKTYPTQESNAMNFRIQRDCKEQVDFSRELSRNVETQATHTRIQDCPCCYCTNCRHKASLNKCTSVCKKDRDIQVDLPEENRRNYEITSGAYWSTSRYQKCLSSHGTQVNFNIGFKSPECLPCLSPVKDEIVQCCCQTSSVTEVECCEESSTESESDDKCLKRCQSPMVVISVYPMQNENEGIKVVTGPPDSKYLLTQNKNISKTPVRESRFINKSPSVSRSRSPSPQKTRSKTNVAETKGLRSSMIRKTSPARGKNVPVPNRTNRQVRINKDKPMFDTDRNRPLTRPEESKKVTKSTNTDYNATKKLLVDNYTKQLTALMQNKEIDKDCKCVEFDCLEQTNFKCKSGNTGSFNQSPGKGKKAADLKTKGKMFSRNSGKVNNDNKFNISPVTSPVISPSLKNLLVEKDQRSISQSMAEDEQEKEDRLTRFHIKDSIEIRRDSLSSRRPSKDFKHEEKFPIKHYRGDNCPIPDPVKRDQEIRALLGIDRGRNPNTTTGCSINKMRPYTYGDKCLNINPLDACACTDVMRSSHSCSRFISVPCPPLTRCECNPFHPTHGCQCPNNSGTSNSNTGFESKSNKNIQCECYGDISQNTSSGSKSKNKEVQCECYEYSSEKASTVTYSKDKNIQTDYKESENKKLYKNLSPKTSSKKTLAKSRATQKKKEPSVEEQPPPRTSLYQQLILNRNIQIFLQVEQFSKQKPIVLTRKQYDKVKKTIEHAIANRRKSSIISKNSLLSIGEVRRKSERQKLKSSIKEAETQQQSSSQETETSSSAEAKQQTYFVCTEKENNANGQDHKTRKVESTIELQCANLSYTKYVTFSSINVEVGSTDSPLLDEKESLSLHTIFAGHRRCTTPNLGTSVYSLNSENDEYLPHPQSICEPKPKKPFLRRLMSCLVMRTARVAELNPIKNYTPPPSNKASINSTFDAYHISSSYCGMDMSSSMFDTSISFYTNHSVYPIHSKIKRGFFNSVREFLSIRRSQSMKNP